MDRIRVIGSSGSGKSTTAEAIARRLDIPRLELDGLHWLPGWRERDAEEFGRLVLDFAQSNPRWVIDGNYNGRLADRVDHLVDTFVWVDLPRWRIMTALLARTIRRSITRENLWGTGNTEKITNLLSRDPHTNLMVWSWTQHHRYQERYGGRMKSGRHRWIRLRSRGEVKRFLQGLTERQL